MASKSNLSRKVLSVFLAFILLFTQTGFAQVASVELNLSSHFIKLGANFTQDKFRLPHLRYFSYDNLTNNIQLFLDKGDLKDLNDSKLEESSQQLLKYFLIGVTLPDDNFWVNLRPDSENNVISDLLAKTDIGRIFLEADVQLKKDTSQLTSPETAQGKIYWDKLYQKAAQIYGTQNVSIPTLTRPWIVPGEIIIRETQQGQSPTGTAPVAPSAYIYKATLNVLLEQDHLKNSAVYNFEDNHAKELNEYSSQLIRELILPGLTKKVNNDKAYASLRQVYYSLILARWFKARFYGKGGLYSSYINKSNLKDLASQQSWSTNTYFKQYQDSFNKGEYNLKTTINTSGGPSIRSYFSGGIGMTNGEMNIIPMDRKTNSSPIMAGFTGRSNITEALTKNFIQLLVTGDGKVSLKTPYLDTPYVNNKKKNGKLLGILSSNNQQLGMRPYLTIDSLPAGFLNDHAQISVYQNFGKNDPEAKPLFTIMTDRKRGLWIQGLNVYQSDFNKRAWEYRTADGYININYLPNDKSIQLSLHFTPSRRPTNEFFQVILEPSSSSPISSSPGVLTEQTSSFMYQGEPIVTGQLPQEVLNLYNDQIILKVLSKKPTLTGIKQVDLDPAMAKFVKYGTSGDRDVVYDEDPAVVSRFNVQRVLHDAQGIASYYKANNLKGAVRLGYETRLMAREYAYLTAAVLAANGIRVKLPANAVPLPSLAFSVADSQETNDPDAGGIMITASHNPWQWLGIKWLLTNGGAAPATVTEPLEKITKEISTASIMSILEARDKGLIVMVDYRQDYINYILNNIPAGAKTALKEWGSKENNKVISNPVQGGAIGYVPQILEALGIRYEERNNTIDRMFAGSDKKGPNPDYAPDFDNNIAQAHKQGQNILEIMQDVDADRFGVRDVNGIRYTANELIPMYKWFLRTKGYKGAIGKTIPTSDLSNAVDEYWGDTTLEVDTGFKNLVDSLESDEVIVAGEESAHVGIGIWKKSKDDGIAVGLLAVWIVAETGKSLTEYKKEIESTIGAHFKYRRIDTPYKGTRRQAGAQMLELINLAEAATVVKRNSGKFNFEYKGNEKEFSNLPIINEKIIPVAEQYGGLSRVLICYDPLSGKSSGYKMVFADNSVVTVRVSGTGEPVIRTYIEIVTPCTNETWDKVDAGSDARWQELANKSRDAIGIYRIEDSSSSPVNFQDPSLMIDTANAKPLGNLTTKKRYSSFSSTMEYISSEFVLDPIPGEFTNRDARIAVYETFEDGKTKNDLLLEVRCEKGGVVWVSGPNVHHYNLNEWEYKMGNTQIKITHDSVNKTIRFTALDSNVKQYRVQNFQVILEPISSSPLNAKEAMDKFYTVTRLLDIKDSKRIAQVLLTSLDPVAFVQSLTDITGYPDSEIIKQLQNNVLFNHIAADYRLRTTKIFDEQEFENRSISIDIGPNFAYAKGKQKDIDGQPLSDYLKTRRNYAGNTAFVFRDNMKQFVARFLGITVENPDSPDLLSLIDMTDIFLNTIDIDGTKYVITSGIGANEMYSHQLAKTLNDFFQSIGINVRWIVVNNPADVQRIPSDANNDNTVIFEMSRSGTTKESLDFFKATKDRFKKRIVGANPGKNNLNTLALELQKEKGASILAIDDTRGDIGGRQMNRRTLMVYLPLYLALVAGLKDKTKAKEYLKEYVQELLDANDNFDYKRGSKSEAVQIAEFLFRHRASGRNKFSVVYDDSLKASAKELFQLVNEGGNKNIAGGSNNNILLSYSLQQDKSLYEKVFDKAAGTQLPVFILNQNSKDHQAALNYIEGLQKKGIPVVVINVNISSDIKKNLRVIARTSALLQDIVVYFTYITNQDANSNPAVKFVREITAAMFEIVKGKKERGQKDIKISFSDVITKIKQKQDSDNLNSLGSMRGKTGGLNEQELPASFNEIANSINSIANSLKVSNDKITDAFISALSKKVVMTDIGEAGANKVSDINASFAVSEISSLGKNSVDPVIPTLDEQKVLSGSGLDGKISVAVSQDIQFMPTGSDISGQLAQYLTRMYDLRSNTLQQIALTYMEVDNNNPDIQNIAKNITEKFADLNITVPLLALPGVAHTGIEAVMSHPENVFNIAIVYTDTYSGQLGEKEIDKNITLNDATYVYGISNVIRMALGGTPSIIFEVKNNQQLKEVRVIIDKAIGIFRQNIASSPIFVEKTRPKTNVEAQKEIDSEFAKINNTILDKKVLDKKLELLYGYWKNGFKVDLKEVFSVVYIVEDRYVAETFEQIGMNVIKHPDSGYATETVNKIIGELRDYNYTSRADSLAKAARKKGLSVSSSPVITNEMERSLAEVNKSIKKSEAKLGLYVSNLLESIYGYPASIYEKLGNIPPEKILPAVFQLINYFKSCRLNYYLTPSSKRTSYMRRELESRAKIASIAIHHFRYELVNAPGKNDSIEELLSLLEILEGFDRYMERDAILPYLLPALRYLAAELLKENTVIELKENYIDLLKEFLSKKDYFNSYGYRISFYEYRKLAADLLRMNRTKVQFEAVRGWWDGGYKCYIIEDLIEDSEKDAYHYFWYTRHDDSAGEEYKAKLKSLLEARKGSSPVNKVDKPGGIDFRSLPMTIQPIGSFRGLNFSLPAASTIAQVNIDKELAEISKMVDTGIMPNGERVKELIAACYHKQELANHQQELMSCLIRICKLEEDMVVPTGKEIKEALVIIDSIR